MHEPEGTVTGSFEQFHGRDAAMVIGQRAGVADRDDGATHRTRGALAMLFAFDMWVA